MKSKAFLLNVRPRNPALLLLAAALGLSAAGARAQSVLVSNLDDIAELSANGFMGGNSSFVEYRAAGSFTTAGGSFTIGSVSLALNDASGSPTGGFSVALYSDAAGAPGSLLAAFTGETDPLTAGIYTYSLASGYAAAANTTYWIVAAAPGQPSSFDYFRWKDVNTNAETSTIGWTIGDTSAVSSNAGISWSDAASEPLFAISSSAVPEPAACAAFLGAAALVGGMLRRRQNRKPRLA